MGLLALGTPLPWSEAKQHADYVREHGIEQLLHIWHRLKDRTGDRLLWGDEVSLVDALVVGIAPRLMTARGETLVRGWERGESEVGIVRPGSDRGGRFGSPESTQDRVRARH